MQKNPTVVSQRFDSFFVYSSGFTLIELMVTVIIIGVLSAIAYGSYNQHVIKANRSAAESLLLSIANKEEQYILDSRLYFCTTGGGCTNVLTGSALPYTVPSNISSNYTISISATDTAPSYTITATPIAGTSQATNDTSCGTLTYDSTQKKGYSGTGSVSSCW
jgi:type IV pilus assembly protein PilE